MLGWKAVPKASGLLRASYGDTHHTGGHAFLEGIKLLWKEEGEEEVEGEELSWDAQKSTCKTGEIWTRPMACISASLSDVMYYSHTRCHLWGKCGKGSMGSLCIISQNCMLISNHLKPKCSQKKGLLELHKLLRWLPINLWKEDQRRDSEAEGWPPPGAWWSCWGHYRGQKVHAWLLEFVGTSGENAQRALGSLPERWTTVDFRQWDGCEAKGPAHGRWGKL